MDTNRIISEFPFELAHRFKERKSLNVSYCTSYFCDYKVIIPCSSKPQHPSFNLVSDVRNYLDCAAEVSSLTLTFNDSLIHFTCRNIVGSTCPDVRETLIVPKVKVSLAPIFRHITFTMFIRIERPWVNVDVRVKLLDGDTIASSLHQR